tara:strand:- start:157 stop:1146 length:990 start_codon:yes stop_codon:yes gene_type:complete
MLGLYFILACVLTLVLTFLIKRYYAAVFLDQPDTGRKRQPKAVSRLGGVGFVLVILALIYALGLMSFEYAWYGIGGSIIALLGLLDDRLSLTWRSKLPIQASLGIALFYVLAPQLNMLHLFSEFVGFKLLYLPLWVCWFLGMVNAVNLCDGVDGLAGGMVIISVLGAGLFGMLPVHVIVAGALVAFLFYNRYPARLYMGDCGSLFLGYHLAVVPLLGTWNGGAGAFQILPFLLMSTYFIWDTTRVFMLRIQAGQNPFRPDQRHFHFTLLSKTKSAPETVLRIWGLHAYFVCCGAAMVYASNKSCGIAFVVLPGLRIHKVKSEVYRDLRG